jgi:hypothetical protein
MDEYRLPPCCQQGQQLFLPLGCACFGLGDKEIEDIREGRTERPDCYAREYFSHSSVVWQGAAEDTESFVMPLDEYGMPVRDPRISAAERFFMG